MSMTGELSFFLVLLIKKDSNGTSISQEKYIKKLLKKFHKVDAKLVYSPMGTNSKLNADGLCPEVNKIMYRGIIGSFLYLTVSRPNIVFSVRMCARFQTCPNESHLKLQKEFLDT